MSLQTNVQIMYHKFDNLPKRKVYLADLDFTPPPPPEDTVGPELTEFEETREANSFVC